ncbi:phage-related antirepressor [Weissella oryzae SG25]|uniref:Phage-related antirepressor n=1 Tax=Weissella oryzae (strain DSM 25784 / JCM 18191 / LMG 30913 / SG25) TaxID=1329250 RepID=A0A069CVN3_WEIOS|nr:phage antirepressor KilAC domain-containing protein [Weissella oryzae]GAK31830.1 phage-related antirepressor [Weissella oryzae SG25]
MDELIKVRTTEQGEQRVSARELHKGLGVKERFSLWFGRYEDMYVEGADFTSVGLPTVVNNGAVRTLQDYSLTTDMAKNVAMMSKTAKSQEIRNYFIAVEKAFNSPEMMMARSLQYAESKMLNYESQIAEMKPKAIFADAVNVSHQTILVGDLAKLISQNGVKIGQNRLFGWLRDNGYLHKQGSRYNRPTQRYIDQGLFKVKESPHINPDGSVKLTFTTKVTGKGQQYFVNKFLNFAGVEEV